MHYTVAALVYAGDPRDARAAARHDVYDPLVEQAVFDYIHLYEDYTRDEPDSDGRLPPSTTLAQTSNGRDLIRDQWIKTVQSYRHALEHIHEFTEHHQDHELWMDHDVYEQYVDDFRRVGQSRGETTFLYDPHGEGIRTLPHLAQVFDGTGYLTDVTDPDDFELYVVPGDAHR